MLAGIITLTGHHALEAHAWGARVSGLKTYNPKTNTPREGHVRATESLHTVPGRTCT
jgi:hypothetical protein